MFEHSNRKMQMMVIAVIGLFLLSSIGCIFMSSADAGANDNQSYTIRMHTNDTFSYQPTVNLSEGVSFTATGYDQAGMGGDWNTSTHTLTIANPTAGTGYTAVRITASTENQDPVWQDIVIESYSRLAIQKSSTTITTDTITLTTDVGKGVTVGEYTVSGTFPVALSMDSSVSNNAPFVVESSGTTYTIKTDSSTAITAGTYTVTLNPNYTSASSSNINAISDAAIATITIVVGSGLVVAPTSAYAVAGAADKTIAITTTAGNSNYAINTWALTAGSPNILPAYLSIAKNGDKAATLTIATSGLTNSSVSSSTGKDIITFSINASGATTGNQTNPIISKTQEFTMSLYKTLEFTTTPIGLDSNFTVNSNDALDVIISTVFEGATHITYDWGDGTFTSKNSALTGNILHTASHKYASAGVYFITVTGENDFGKASSITMYNAYGSSSMTENTVKSSKISSTYNDDGTITLYSYPIIAGSVSAGTVPIYKWAYKVGGGSNTSPVTDSLEFVKEITDNKLVVYKNQLSDDTTFYMDTTVQFANGEVKTSEKVSWTFNDTSFFAKHGYQFIIFAILALILLLFARQELLIPGIKMFGFIILVLLAIGCFLFKDIDGIANALGDFFGNIKI